MNIPALLLSLTMAACASGCYVSARPAAAVVDYQPVYYDDWIVYYDNDGLPYCYVNGRVVYVARTDIRFHFFASHYRKHGSAYRHWYRVDGHRRYERRHQWQQRRRHPKRSRPSGLMEA